METFAGYLEHFNRRTSMDQMCFLITGTGNETAGENHVPPQYISEYSGYLGIRPWTADDERNINYNFLYQLKQAKKIDYAVVSFFVEPRDDDQLHSTIKFGGWDKIGLKDEDASNLQLVKTATTKSWNIRMNQFKIGERMTVSGNWLFRFEP